MKIFKTLSIFIFIFFISIIPSFSQYCDRSFEAGAGLEYPLYQDKYNPMLTLDLYIYCIGLGTDFGLLYNNERVEEFGIGKYLGPSFNFDLYTKFDMTRINHAFDRFFIDLGYKYSSQTLTRINDLKGKSNYLYIKTEFCVSKYLMLYNKLDFKFSSNHNENTSGLLVSFGLRFFFNSQLKGFKRSANYSDQ